MKNKKILLIALCALSLMCGCGTPTQAAPRHSEQAEDLPETTCMPVLSIETKSQEKNVMRFVTEPVTAYVSESIASWTPGYKIPAAPYYEECYITLKDTHDAVLLDAVEGDVKVRGNWTTSYEKKPLRIKFAEKQSMLGMNDGAEMKNWVLLAGYKDGSLLRDKTALSIARELLGEDGLYAADAQFVEVEINQQYWGVYLLTEFQQINPNRVNIAEPEKEYTGTDIGYFMEFDGYYFLEDPLQQFHVDYVDNAPLIPFDGKGGSGKTETCLSEGYYDIQKDTGITIKSDINSQEQHDFIASYVNNVYRIMYEAAYRDEAYQFSSNYASIAKTTDMTPQQAVEQVVNVQSLADMYIISELTCDTDIYWSSFFMDVDFSASGDRKLNFEAPWDFDSAMGNKKGRCEDSKGFFAANSIPDVNSKYTTINPWLAVLMYEDWFQDIISERWTNAYDSGIFTRGIQMIQSDTEQYADAFDRNYQKWNNIVKNDVYVNELCRNAEKCKTHRECAEYLAKWLSDRVAFLNDYWHK